MSAKVLNKLTAEKDLMTEILAAVQKSGLSEEAVKIVLNRIIEVIEEEA
jgi:hypothetical protein